MKNRMIGIIGAVDQNGLYGIGEHMPWGTPLGTSCLRQDTKHFVQITRKTAPEGKKNTLIVGHQTAKAFNMYPLPGRRMIVVSRTLQVGRFNVERPEERKIYAARTCQEALGLALSWGDGAHVFFSGGRDIWAQGLKSELCNCAFITLVRCDAFAESPFRDEPFYAPELLQDETFLPMKRAKRPQIVPDMWGDISVKLEFRNYKKT